MLKDNKKSEKSFKKIIKKNQDGILEDITKKYDQAIEQGKHFGQESLKNISKSTKSGTDFIKSQPHWKSIRNGSVKIKEKSLEQGKVLKKQSPKFYKKISNGFFYFFEAIVGRIKIGTQYGSSSLDLLERLAKLKELGILTEEEFTKKKKKILERI